MVRSATATPRCFSRLRCCAGERAWSNRTASAWCSCTSSLSSSALPEPMKNAGSGALRRATIRPTAMSPADSASSANSSSEASKDAFWPMSTPTRMARAGGPADSCPAFKAPPWRGLDDASRLLGGFRLRLEIDRPARHDGGNRVLVDHLSHGVAKQDDVLVEGLDVALQLDAVDEVDGN